MFAFDAGRIMGALCAVTAILTATAGLDAEQRTTLHRFATPMFQMNGTRLRNQIKERLMIERVQFFETSRVVIQHPAPRIQHRTAMLNRQSAIRIPQFSSPIYRLRK